MPITTTSVVIFDPKITTSISSRMKFGTVSEGFGDPHQRGIDPATIEARNRADQNTNNDRHRRRGDADQQRRARAIKQLGDDVAANRASGPKKLFFFPKQKARIAERRLQRPARQRQWIVRIEPPCRRGHQQDKDQQRRRQ